MVPIRPASLLTTSTRTNVPVAVGVTQHSDDATIPQGDAQSSTDGWMVNGTFATMADVGNVPARILSLLAGVDTVNKAVCVVMIEPSQSL